MLRSFRRHLTYANLMATIAVFIALGGASYAAITLPKNSVGRAQLKSNAVNGAKITNGAVARRDLAKAVRSQLDNAGKAGPAGPQGTTGSQGTAGAQGPQGTTGSQGTAGAQGSQGDRGPSFGDGRQIGNLNNFPCQQDVVVGSQTVTVSQQSRIWVYGQGVIRDKGAAPSEYGLWLRLRNANDTATLAVSTRAWEVPESTGDAMALSSGGVMLTGANPEANASAFVAPAGTYQLQLAVLANGATCATAFPDFGYNQGSGMAYMLLGNG